MHRKKLKADSPRVKELLERIEEEIERRPTVRVRTLRKFYEVWVAGLNGVVPEMFKHLEHDIDAKKDPEWAEFQRLLEKFSRKTKRAQRRRMGLEDEDDD